ncbi:hypothetical protein F4859DRAFT_472021 [Xylaria cf. heliscus]|nr:hypothetical protein F4859DRAFT_472021 [Xylaria cf. heliscus]
MVLLTGLLSTYCMYLELLQCAGATHITTAGMRALQLGRKHTAGIFISTAAVVARISSAKAQSSVGTYSHGARHDSAIGRRQYRKSRRTRQSGF